MEIKERLKKEVWRSEVYYQLAKKGSLDIKHPAMVVLQKLAGVSNRILDLGCGEGTRLYTVVGTPKKGVGVDISETAINLARKSYPKINFIVADLEKIPLKKNSFDLVYSAYVLEHLTNPSKVLLEAIRLTSKSGYLVLVAPNYGAPNRASPCFSGSRMKKFIQGFINDLLIPFNEKNSLSWNPVKPIAGRGRYNIDWDTVVEPYAGNLVAFLRKHKMQIMEFNTCWSEELKNAKMYQKIFRFLGQFKIYPFSMWGPHLVVVARKNKYES